MYFTPCWFNVQQTTLMGCKEQPEILVPWTTCFLGYAAAFTLLSLICDLSSDELHNLHLLKFLLLSLTRFSFAGSRNSHAIRRQILPVYSFSFFYFHLFCVYRCFSHMYIYAPHVCLVFKGQIFSIFWTKPCGFLKVKGCMVSFSQALLTCTNTPIHMTFKTGLLDSSEWLQSTRCLCEEGACGTALLQQT